MARPVGGELQRRGGVRLPGGATEREGGRRATLYHEAGHGLEEAVGLSGIGRYFGVDPLAVVTLPGAQRFGHNASEVVAEAYAVLWTEPQWAKGFEGGQAILGTVAKMARDNGYPLP